jgi:hypothetical protein
MEMATLRDTLGAAIFALAVFGGGCGHHIDLPPSLIDFIPESHDAAGDVPPESGKPATATCSQAATRLYLMDTAGRLYSFDPTMLPSPAAFQKIGTMNCTWAGAASMAIDRNAVAWVTDRNGSLFEVSTVDARCRPTKFHNQHGFTKVGMGFAGDVTDGTETLFVVDNSNASITGGSMGLGSLDLKSMALTPRANFDGPFAGLGAELTGSGDGRLFGFFPGESSLAQIDPTTAHIIGSHQVGLGLPVFGSGEYDFAVSFWGGSFFFYTAYTLNAAGSTTDVTAFDLATGEITLVASQIGFNVTGAGSSTCVPMSGDFDNLLHRGVTRGDGSNDAGLEAGADAGLDSWGDAAVDAEAEAE